MNFVAISRFNNGRYQTKATHWPSGWHFQILDPDAWGRSPSGIGDGPVIDQGFQKELEQRGWSFTPAEPITPENATAKVGPLPEPENVRDREMKRLAASFKPKTESKAAQIVAALLDHCGHCPEDATKVVAAMPKKRFAHGTQSSRIAQKVIGRPKGSFYPSSGGPSSM